MLWSGTGLYAITTGDLNGDYYPDLVTANATAGTVSIFLSIGQGNFSSANSYSMASGPRALALADLNHDNNLDVITANYSNNSVSVRLGNGLGGLGNVTTFTVGSGPSGVTTADLNGDSHVDIVSANQNSDTVSVRLGNGSGGFGAATNYAVGDGPIGLLASDFNNDGIGDLVTANKNSGSLSILLGLSQGGFAGPGNIPTGSGATHVSSGDFNGDGSVDLVCGNSVANTITVLKGNGAGGFSIQGNHSLSGNFRSLLVSDISHDGKPDIITSIYIHNSNFNNNKGALSVFLGTGQAGFGPEILTRDIPLSGAIALADYDLNSQIDLAVGSNLAVSVPNIAVFFGDGAAGFLHGRSRQIANFESYQINLPDLNSDGNLDLVAIGAAGVSVGLGNGSGDFGAITTYTDIFGDRGRSALADINYDGNLDVIVPGGYFAGILYGSGNGGFLSSGFVEVANGALVRGVAVLDFNNDGLLDIVAAGLGGVPGCAVTIAYGDLLNGFELPEELVQGVCGTSLLLSDIDNNGSADLVVTTPSNQLVTIRSNGFGGIPLVNYHNVGGDPQYATAGDVNNDGRVDLVTANYLTSTASLLLGTGGGNFGPATNISTHGSLSVSLGDLNGDGNLDLVAPAWSFYYVGVRLGDGTGQFGTQRFYAVDSEPYGVALGDLNGDSKLDLVSSSYYTDLVTILYNQEIPSIIDCNQNGIEDPTEITGNSLLDNDVDFGGDGILDICQGRVSWQQTETVPLGVVGARINAYWISGSDASPVFNLIPESPVSASHLTNSEGEFIVPAEYFSYPTQPGELARGIKASLTYTDDTGLQVQRTVVNYPGWDPLKPLRSKLFDRKIYFPSPVVFQPGVLARVNLGSIDRIRGFMTLDAGTSSSGGTDSSYKRGSFNYITAKYEAPPLPSFLFFAIPSDNSGSLYTMRDGVPWGYNNNPFTTNSLQVAENAVALDLFISQRMKPQVDPFVTGHDASQIPINLVAHSYGGVITRKWMSYNDLSVSVNRYVSLDGVHGGTGVALLQAGPILSQLGFGSWFTERNMNGSSPTQFSAPNRKGWNYSHRLNPDFSHLFISDTPNPIIDPYTSALGIGRTISSLGLPIPNGHCERFAGGWEMQVSMGTHSIQDRLPVVVSTTRFLAYGTAPYIGDDIDPIGSVTTALPSDLPNSTSYASVGCGIGSGSSSPPLGTLVLSLSLPSTGVTSVPFPVDSQSGSLRFNALLSSLSASIDLLNGTTPIAKVNHSITTLGDGSSLQSFDIPLSGTINKTLRLSASEPAFASVHVTFTNSRHLVGETDSATYSLNTPVLIKASLRGQNNNTIVPSSGAISAKVADPHGIETLITLYDDGLHGDGAANNGIYANSFTTTSTPGFYQINFLSNHTWAGWPIQRSTTNSFEVLSSAASLSTATIETAVDSDGDGLIEAWRVSFNTTVNQSGTFRLSTVLVGQQGDLQTLSTTFNASPGIVTSGIDIPSSILHLMNLTQGYSLNAVRLSESIEGQTLTEIATIPLAIPSNLNLEPLPAPVVTMGSPNFGPHTGGTKVLLSGQHLDATQNVIVGGRAANFTVFSDRLISVTIPPRMRLAIAVPIGSPGSTSQGNQTPVNITVKNPSGQVTMPNIFTYID